MIGIQLIQLVMIGYRGPILGHEGDQGRTGACHLDKVVHYLYATPP